MASASLGLRELSRRILTFCHVVRPNGLTKVRLSSGLSPNRGGICKRMVGDLLVQPLNALVIGVEVKVSGLASTSCSSPRDWSKTLLSRSLLVSAFQLRSVEMLCGGSFCRNAHAVGQMDCDTYLG